MRALFLSGLLRPNDGVYCIKSCMCVRPIKQKRKAIPVAFGAN